MPTNHYEDIDCTHRYCNRPLMRYYARWKWSEEHGANMPYHTDCSYASPDYDVSKGCGSPFTTITGPAGVTTGQST